MKRVVRASVCEVLTKPSPDFEPEVRCDGDIALIEQAMEICPQKETVRNFMRTVETIRFDVRGFEYRKRMLLGDGAAAVVGGHGLSR